MIRVATFRLPSHRGSQITILPDGLEHPKFRGRRSGEGHYIVCWNEVADAAVQKGMSIPRDPDSFVNGDKAAQGSSNGTPEEPLYIRF